MAKLLELQGPLYLFWSLLPEVVEKMDIYAMKIEDSEKIEGVKPYSVAMVVTVEESGNAGFGATMVFARSYEEANAKGLDLARANFPTNRFSQHVVSVTPLDPEKLYQKLHKERTE